MYAALGLFVFELATVPFSEEEHRRSWRHEPVSLVGERDSAQFVGPRDDVKTLSGILAPELAGSYAEIDTLNDMADAGEPYTFVDGTGRVWGEYVIVALDLRKQHLLIDGVPRMVDFAIDLKRIR
ncbi:MAG: phage tail protein [Novosphingobium sp.]|nr:phage tail protein [Novosphingobium sp.]